MIHYTIDSGRDCRVYLLGEVQFGFQGQNPVGEPPKAERFYFSHSDCSIKMGLGGGLYQWKIEGRSGAAAPFTGAAEGGCTGASIPPKAMKQTSPLYPYPIIPVV